MTSQDANGAVGSNAGAGRYHRGTLGTAGIVLAGGRSSRMGASKAALEWHGSTLLRRVTGIVARVVDGPVLVVRAAGQPLPALPAGVDVLEDPGEGLGPLQGMAVGLAAAAAHAEAAFVCSTDLPFLHAAFVTRVLGAFAPGTAAVLPVARGHRQPLAAAYATALAPVAAQLVAQRRLRPAFLFDERVVVQLDDGALLADPQLARLDPDLDSVVNLNTPEEYDAARRRAPPQVRVERFGTLAADGHRGARDVRAATLAGAAAAVRLTLDRHVVAALNGDHITRDGDLPLVTGDTVAFLAADAGG